MVSDDRGDFLKSQLQILNAKFHSAMAAGGTFEDVKGLYLQMKSLHQQANALGIDINPTTSVAANPGPPTNNVTRS